MSLLLNSYLVIRYWLFVISENMSEPLTKPKTSSSYSTVFSYLELMRPANIVTAFADILAGFAAAGGFLALAGGSLLVSPRSIDLVWLLASTFGLYGGGVVFNDIFDVKLDARERPERTIPSGRVSKTGAIVLGVILLSSGVLFAFQVTFAGGMIAIAIAVCAFLYDYWAKHSVVWGPLFMGLCRGGNLLLGASIIPLALSQIWFLAPIPIAYIAAITLISQGEVHGGSRATGLSALLLVLLVTGFLLLLPFITEFQFLTALPFIVIFGIAVLPPFYKAYRNPLPEIIKKAVKKGVISLILLNAAIAAGFAGFILGILTLLLLPISLLLSKIFAVT